MSMTGAKGRWMAWVAAVVAGVLAATAGEGAELLYCLQPQGGRAAFPARVAEAGRSHIVVDASFDGGEQGRWSAAEVRAFGKNGAEVLCYLSVGEAEDYRGYWRRDWKRKAPGFLLEENPEWEGNCRVRYWDAEWQGIILKELGRIVAAGFDGVYLDIVDGYEFFEGFGAREGAVNPATGRTFRADMAEWILRIAAHARASRPGFRVFMQNGEALLADGRLRSAVDGVAMEDVFFDEGRRRGAREIRERLACVAEMQAAGKACFAVEYPPRGAEGACEALAREFGIGVLATDRELRGAGRFFAAP